MAYDVILVHGTSVVQHFVKLCGEFLVVSEVQLHVLRVGALNVSQEANEMFDGFSPRWRLFVVDFVHGRNQLGCNLER